MSRIKILPEILANQIAAGEVVQRPASIVKELIENALDANASAITISLEHGGKSLIRLVDDGHGMDEEDALLAFERHATSKIAELNDLLAIQSFGFRGEALPSIASVSHIRLVTATSDGEGVEITIEGGKIRNVKPSGSPRGTEIQVRRLFFNTPARRKFLKSTFTEYNHCLNIVTRCAVVHPQIAWHLDHDGKTVLHTPPAQSMKQRISQVFGDSYLDSMISFEGNRDDIRLDGLLGNLFLARSDRSQQYFYVNRRPVYNMTMRNALTNVTKNVLPHGKFPVIFICVECAPEHIDVNVHPAKTEIAFRQEWLVYDLLVEVLSDIFSHHVPTTTPRFNSAATQSCSAPLSGIGRAIEAGPRDRPAETTISAVQATSPEQENKSPIVPPEIAEEMPVTGTASDDAPGSAPWQRSTDFFRSLHFIGQVFQSFLIYETSNEMIMIDQHAAHERILFEKIRDKLQQQALPVQHLLIPETIDLSPGECQFTLRMKELFDRIGFGIDQFGKNTIVIRSIPAWLGQHDPRPLFLEIMEKIKERASLFEGPAREATSELAKLLACRSAIKIHRNVTSLEASDLVRQLALTAVPFTCPHGRPIIVSFGFHDLERFFKR